MSGASPAQTAGLCYHVRLLEANYKSKEPHPSVDRGGERKDFGGKSPPPRNVRRVFLPTPLYLQANELLFQENFPGGNDGLGKTPTR